MTRQPVAWLMLYDPPQTALGMRGNDPVKELMAQLLAAGRLDALRRLATGDPVSLVWEPAKPHDGSAAAVRAGGGDDPGYLRHTLAKVLAERIREEGAALSAAWPASWTTTATRTSGCSCGCV